MLFFLQFPIADLRRFSTKENSVLPLPHWPPEVGLGIPTPFVRSFGGARERLRGPDHAFLDEMSFFDASRALKLPQLHPSDGVTCAFRRLLSDGRANVRIEIGLHINPIKFKKNGTTAFPDLLTLVQDLITTSTRTQTYVENEPETKPLIQQGPALAKIYTKATTKKNKRDRPNLVKPLKPIIIIECRGISIKQQKNNIIKFPLNKTNNTPLHKFEKNTPNGKLEFWVIESNGKSEKNRRSLRLCLSRLHSEQQVLQAVLASISSGEIKHKDKCFEGDLLDAYLNKATRVINEKYWANIQQSAIIESFEANLKSQPEYKIQHLKENLSGARRQIQSKSIESFRLSDQSFFQTQHGEINVTNNRIKIGDNNSVSGNIVISKNIENSFNSIKKSNIDDDLKIVLESITNQIKILHEKAPTEDTSGLAELNKNLVTSVTSENPSKNMCNIYIEGMKTLAQSIGTIARPILDNIDKLVPLIASIIK